VRGGAEGVEVVGVILVVEIMVLPSFQGHFPGAPRNVTKMFQNHIDRLRSRVNLHARSDYRAVLVNRKKSNGFEKIH
jgi:hypothetical protein